MAFLDFKKLLFIPNYKGNTHINVMDKILKIGIKRMFLHNHDKYERNLLLLSNCIAINIIKEVLNHLTRLCYDPLKVIRNPPYCTMLLSVAYKK